MEADVSGVVFSSRPRVIPMQIETVPIASLHSDPSNARGHSTKNIDAIKASLAKFGQQKPIVVDAKDVVIAGNGTLEAAKALDWDTLTIHRTDLSGPDAIAFAIADNRTAELANWENEALGAHLQALREDGWDLGELGFELDDLEELLPTDDHQGKTDDDATPEVDGNPFEVERGQIWLLGDHRLMCGDSTAAEDVDRLMDGEKADMVFTDPPYGANIIGSSGQLGGSKPFGNIGNMVGKIVKSGVYSPVIGDETTDTAKKAFDLCVGIKSQVFWGAQYYAEHMPPNSGWLVWDKETDGSLGDGELAWTNQKKAVRIFKHKWSGMIKASEHGQRRVHPTQKPIALAEWCFENYGDPKSVLDLFLGSGSTLIACEKTKRKCYGMEIDPHYCSVIIKRWQDYTGKEAERA